MSLREHLRERRNLQAAAATTTAVMLAATTTLRTARLYSVHLSVQAAPAKSKNKQHTCRQPPPLPRQSTRWPLAHPASTPARALRPAAPPAAPALCSWAASRHACLHARTGRAWGCRGSRPVSRGWPTRSTLRVCLCTRIHRAGGRGQGGLKLSTDCLCMPLHAHLLTCHNIAKAEALELVCRRLGVEHNAASGHARLLVIFLQARACTSTWTNTRIASHTRCTSLRAPPVGWLASDV